jgi:glycosidase
LSQYSDVLPSTACPAWFTSNHDENSWNGTEYEKYGEMAIPLAVFSATYKGIPLMYSGQEIPNRKRLQFFDQDPLDWTNSPALHPFYRSILHLRKNHAAFTTVAAAANLVKLGNSVDHHVISFKRHHDDSTAIVLINFSAYPLHNIEVDLDGATGTFVYHFTSLAHECTSHSHCFHLQPWSYQIWLQ